MTCEQPGCAETASYTWDVPSGGYLFLCDGCARAYDGGRLIPLDGPRWYGHRLRMAREVRGMERESLAALMGISELALWRIEQGEEPFTDEWVALAMTRGGLDVLVGFFERKPIDESFPKVGCSLWWHTPKKDLCERCWAGIAVALCDWPDCDKRLCDDCRSRPDATTDYCRWHPVAAKQGALL